MTLMQVKNLKTYFGINKSLAKVVDNVSFDIEAGQTLGLVGESGCGKSMTALSVMQLLPTVAQNAGGQILFKGQDILKMSPDERREMRGRHISMIFQEPMTSLNPVLTVRTQLLEAIGKTSRQADGTLRKLSRSERLAIALEALELVEMPEAARRLKEYPHQLSGGMRQRVMIAMAMASRPELLIADEPTTALDVTVEAKILDLLNDLQAKLGTSILFITHDLAVISKMAQKVAVMYAGKIVETAPDARAVRQAHAPVHRAAAELPTQPPATRPEPRHHPRHGAQSRSLPERLSVLRPLPPQPEGLHFDRRAAGRGRARALRGLPPVRQGRQAGNLDFPGRRNGPGLPRQAHRRHAAGHPGPVDAFPHPQGRAPADGRIRQGRRRRGHDHSPRADRRPGRRERLRQDHPRQDARPPAAPHGRQRDVQRRGHHGPE